jgi:23S rRNA maturation-related 3'-5' exoribonuclease YhaM
MKKPTVRISKNDQRELERNWKSALGTLRDEVDASVDLVFDGKTSAAQCRREVKEAIRRATENMRRALIKTLVRTVIKKFDLQNAVREIN